MTISLSLAQEMKAAGIEVESEAAYFYHHKYGTPHDEKTWECQYIGHSVQGYSGHKDGHVIPAPTFTEIWAVMPEEINAGQDTADLFLGKCDGDTIAGYEETILYDGTFDVHTESHKSPAEAAGQLLLWLKKEGHV